MEEFNIRKATISDVRFLAEAIIEAEKAGTDILSWSTIFGLSENDAKQFIEAMLMEEIDGCELSISSFIVAETEGRVVAALSAWVEGINNESSAQLKGNLLSFHLPKECIKKATAIYPVLQDIHIDYIKGTIQKGAGYIIKEYRNRHLFQILTNNIIEYLLESNPDVNEAYTQIYGCNIPAIKANEKVGFNIVLEKESSNEEILQFVPSNKKVMMRKIITR